MEIHHHGGHHEGTKKFKDYFLEFLMLFLAITLGFFSENVRETYADRAKEKEYIRGIVEDLSKDTAILRAQYEANLVARIKIDSLIRLFNRPDRGSFGSELYYLARTIPVNTYSYRPNERTYGELKSSGNLRLIKSAKIADSVSAYYYNVEFFKTQVKAYDDIRTDYINSIKKIFNGEIFQEMEEVIQGKDLATLSSKTLFSPPPGNPPLANRDPALSTELIGNLHFLFGRNEITGVLALETIREADHLLHLLNNAYKLNP
jgi:hypothetical protein